jgi:hypothetical protein
MTSHPHVATADAGRPDVPRAPLGTSLATLVSKIGDWVEVCADYYAAAALYEQLSALSDAELARRGLSRATLAQDAQAACEHGTRHL